jgi:hypothetical protein
MTTVNDIKQEYFCQISCKTNDSTQYTSCSILTEDSLHVMLRMLWAVVTSTFEDPTHTHTTLVTHACTCIDFTYTHVCKSESDVWLKQWSDPWLWWLDSARWKVEIHARHLFEQIFFQCSFHILFLIVVRTLEVVFTLFALITNSDLQNKTKENSLYVYTEVTNYSYVKRTKAMERLTLFCYLFILC